MIDLAEVLKNVPDSGTGREQIEYIDLERIGSDPNNFYELSGIEKLAANIELCGLMDPIRVRTDPEDSGRVVIVSGHRRRAAIQLLVDGGREDLRKVPCIRETVCTDPRMQELRLIYANADTREMSNADKARQAERTEALLYELKEAGQEFPGRMRDHVAEICRISKSKLSRLKVIRERLDSVWVTAWEAGDLGESVAYALAQIPEEHQKALFENRETRGLSAKSLYEVTVRTAAERLKKIDKLGCKKAGGLCLNAHEMKRKALQAQQWEHVNCLKCCGDCPELERCKSACPCLADKVRQLKEEAKERKAREASEKEERDRPEVEQIQQLWSRFGEARMRAGLDVEAVFKAIGRSYGGGAIQEACQLEAGMAKVTTMTTLPYGYTERLDDVKKFVRAADALGCSLDWLLCRTDDPQGGVPGRDLEQNAPAQSQPGCRWYTNDQLPEDGKTVIVVDECGFVSDERFKDGKLTGSVVRWDEVVFWTSMPKENAVEPQPVGQMMICGWMPGGTTPAQPCDVVAAFDVGGNVNRMIVRWNGTGFEFMNGAAIEMEPIRWMALPPEEDEHGEE